MTLVTGEQIAATKPYHIIEHGDYKIGFIGIAEIEWVATLAAFDEDDINFEDIVESSEKWSEKLSKYTPSKIFLKETSTAVISSSP